MSIDRSGKKLSIEKFQYLTDEEMKDILDSEEILLLTIEAAKHRAMQKINDSGSFYDYKLVPSRGKIEFKKDSLCELQQLLGDKFYTGKKSITITEAKKLLPEEELAQFTCYVEGKPILKRNV